MWPILVGIETEYGLTVEGRGATEQVDDSMALVRESPDGRFVGWDYRFESPRADLRGYVVDRLNVDPEDARYDQGRHRAPDTDVRSDRVLANGARLYNDHGHPEYATPECWSLSELVLQDLAGEQFVARAAERLAEKAGRAVRVYKNNTDYHGASYGTHESYLVPRELGFERLYKSVVPILVARTVVCGAGKTGFESGEPCEYQISQRADFFAERAGVDTLYRRPVFNTRDEPHANPGEWIRLHVISGDANRMPAATARKCALVKLALWLEGTGHSLEWSLEQPERAMRAVSRDLTGNGRVQLAGSDWTTPRQIIESLGEAASRHLDAGYPGVAEALQHVQASIDIFDSLASDGELAARQVDWAAKLAMLRAFQEEDGLEWNDPACRSADLSFHCLDPEEDLFAALVECGMTDPLPRVADIEARMAKPQETNRALARSVAVSRFADSLKGVSWGKLTFEMDGKPKTVSLSPEKCYARDMESAGTVEDFIALLEEER
ncbi:MAG: proteasome accessory factor PafA2 family protein [Armatimonadetes bacterium]|nr:proteasome accessory factor PafA2 family protein [Armatimonadota bacterium]